MGNRVTVLSNQLLHIVPEFWCLIDEVDWMVNNIIVVLKQLMCIDGEIRKVSFTLLFLKISNVSYASY